MSVFITSNIYQRTFCIRYNGNQGTCFAIEHDGKQYLITARHIVASIVKPTLVEILHAREWKTLPVQLVGHSPIADVTVLAPGLRFAPLSPVLVEPISILIGQEVRFLGFPYGMSTDMGTLNNDFPLPLVKQGLFSGGAQDEGKSLWLDGHNNPGFSGGPVVYQSAPSDLLTVFGIISGYHNEVKHLYLEDKTTPFQYYDNTGIIVAAPIERALELIRSNPIGFDVSSEMS